MDDSPATPATAREMTTVQLLKETAAYLRDEHGHFDAADALDARAERLREALATAEADVTRLAHGAYVMRLEAIRSLNAPEPAALPEHGEGGK